jgi:large subunit ribosomal protein L23
MIHARDIIIKPIVSEKSYALIKQNKYTFQVSRRANKTEIKQAVEKIFGVKVVNVNTINLQGKRRRQGFTVGRKPNWKKAIVTLKQGQTIEIFEGIS